MIEKGCHTCKYFNFMEGECTKGIATKLESRDFDTSKCEEYALDEFWNGIGGGEDGK